LSGAARDPLLPGPSILPLGAGRAAARLAGCLLAAFAVTLGRAWWMPAPACAPVLSWKGDGR